MVKRSSPLVMGFALSAVTATLLGYGLSLARIVEYRKGFVYAFLVSASLASAIALLGRKHQVTWNVILPWYWMTVIACALGVLLLGCLSRVWIHS